MKTKKIALQMILSAAFLALLSTSALPAYQSPEASQFLTGFNSFKKREYGAAIRQFSPILEQPESQLRELVLVFLARAYYHEGNRGEAAYLLHFWKQEFPASTLGSSIEPEILRETAKVDVNAIIAHKEQERIAREKAEQERLAAIRAEEERKAREKAEAERIAREKAEAERLANHKTSILAAATSPATVIGLPSGELTATAAREMTIPLTVTNPGVIPDRFTLATTLPSAWKARFESDGRQVSATSDIAPGATATVRFVFTPPATILEGEQLVVHLSARSRAAGEKAITTEFRMTSSAPIVRAVVKKLDSVDGEASRAQCLISVLNVGSADADALTLTVTHSESYEAQANNSKRSEKTAPGRISIGPFRVGTGELQEFLLNFSRKGKQPVTGGISCKAEITLE
jgi:hypothetical protein